MDSQTVTLVTATKVGLSLMCVILTPDSVSARKMFKVQDVILVAQDPFTLIQPTPKGVLAVSASEHLISVREQISAEVSL